MRTIAIGDVHGYLGELRDLLDKLALSSDDRLVFLGDLIDRGPDSPGVVKLVRELGAHCIMGNHEEKMLRYLAHEQRSVDVPGYHNPMEHPGEKRLSEWKSLSKEDLEFLRSCPFFSYPLSGWVAVHGGVLPGSPIESQRKDQIVRLRWVDDEGRYVGAKGREIIAPPGTRPWSEAYDGKLSVVCGHVVHGRDKPRVDKNTHGAEVWSIDTGCGYQGKLSALVLETREVIQSR